MKIYVRIALTDHMNANHVNNGAIIAEIEEDLNQESRPSVDISASDFSDNAWVIPQLQVLFHFP